MKKHLLFFALSIGLTGIFPGVHAQLRLPDIYSDNMVLQQKAIIHLWGWCNPSEAVEVIVPWQKDTLRTKSTPGAKWTVDLKTPGAGGPYEITVISGDTVVIHNVLIGEVWLCGGQSNMQMNADWNYQNAAEEISHAHYPDIRFFKVELTEANYPQQELRGAWQICSPQSMRGFSGAGYFFGRRLYDYLKQPMGLIQSCWGGTPVETWMPASIFRSDSVLAKSAAGLETVPWCPVQASVCYNAMIYPLQSLSLAGVIWYQGEANVVNPDTYKEAFGKMIKAWRSLWHQEFPFYFVQIAPFKYEKPYQGALIREAQLQTFKTVANTGVVVITDITGDTNNIHPKDKQDVGIRLANWALARHYGFKDVVYSGPIYRSMTIQGDKITLSFDFSQNGLKQKGSSLNSFLIAGSDRHFQKAQAKIVGNSIEVYSPMVSHPVAVRFGFSNTAIPNLFNKSGLPASPFRTDKWSIK